MDQSGYSELDMLVLYPSDMIKDLHLFILLALCTGLLGCTPTPSDIPRDAERLWSLKGNYRWEWNRNLEHGCVAWVAKESYAVVYVFVDAQCDSARDSTFFKDKMGVDYSSFSDQLLFMGYSSWKPDYSRDSIKDENGKSIGWPERCPYSVSQSQIDALRVVLTEALEVTVTDGEQRILNRVDKRLSETDGSALRVSYLGCVDVTNDRARRETGEIVDLWGDNLQSD
ncbi:MAG: hypothetical protein DHS20C05_17730 [Hyphococcus sp.]|nr:MAG: hypothetical protein DHS20C05_17730 [Marinicaulis sp.]